MSLTHFSKYDIALHGVPMCAICNKPVESMKSLYSPNSMAKQFFVFCHGESEAVTLPDEFIENCDSIRMGQAFIDKLPQPQLERK
jgi:hypothetical protein